MEGFESLLPTSTFVPGGGGLGLVSSRKGSRKGTLQDGKRNSHVMKTSTEVLCCIKAMRAALEDLRKHVMGDEDGKSIYAKLRIALNKLARGIVMHEVGDKLPSVASPPPVSPSNLSISQGSQRKGSDVEYVSSRGVCGSPLATKSWQASTILHGIMQGIMREVDAERATLYLFAQSRDALTADSPQVVSVASVGVNGKRSIPSHKIYPTTGMVGHVFQTGLMLNVIDTETASDKVFNRNTDQRTGFYTRNSLCFPLTKRFPNVADNKMGVKEKASNPKNLLGVVEIMNKLPPIGNKNPFTEDDELVVLEHGKLLSSIIDTYNITANDVLQHYDTMQELTFRHCKESPGTHWAQNPTNTVHTHSEMQKRRVKIQSIANSLLQKVNKEGTGSIQPAERARREDTLVYRTGTRGTGKGSMKERSSLREVAIYIERIEECWKASRERAATLEQQIEKKKTSKGGHRSPVVLDLHTYSNGDDKDMLMSTRTEMQDPDPFEGLSRAAATALFREQLRDMLTQQSSEREQLFKSQEMEVTALYQRVSSTSVAVEKPQLPPWCIPTPPTKRSIASSSQVRNKICKVAGIEPLWS